MQSLVAPIDRSGNDEQATRLVLVSREVLGLGTLMGTQDVLDRKRVKPILLRQGLDDVHPVEAVDVDPADVDPGRR